MIDKNEAIKQGFAVIEGENSNANAENSSKNTQNLSQNDINSTQNAFLRHIKSKFPHLIRDNTLDFKGVAKILVKMKCIL